MESKNPFINKCPGSRWADEEAGHKQKLYTHMDIVCLEFLSFRTRNFYIYLFIYLFTYLFIYLFLLS